jgi:hypothetical protein
MVQLGDAIARYHKLFDEAGYRDLAWAEAFQERMREQRFTESGRLLAPILRPQFLSRRQVDLLTNTAEHICRIADQVAQFAVDSPALLNRLKLLPGEKMLAAAKPGYSRFQVMSRIDALVENGSLSIHGVDACKPTGVVCSDQVADMFLQLPIVKDFKRGKYKLSKLGGAKRFQAAVLQAWKEFGGRAEPQIAIVEMDGGNAESHIFKELLLDAGSRTRVVSADELVYGDRKLRAGDFVIDIALRCVSTRDLLIRFGLSHPLFTAYRDSAVCVINNFRSEIGRRRALFELLTDDAIAARLDPADRKLIRAFVPWTRVVAQRKTTYKDQQIEFVDFILRNRAKLILRPNEDTTGQPVFSGAAMTQSAWERVVKLALQTPYVVQETTARGREPFPVFQYGELQMREVEVSVHPNLFNGRVQGASAALQIPSANGSSFVAVAPVLLLENLEN